MLPAVRVNVQVLVPELKKHGILLDESIMYTHMDTIDELHYVMYRLGKKESGLQIFYRCLRETQDECPQHRLVADRIERKGKNNFIIISTLSLVSKYDCFCVSIHHTVCQVSITDLHSGSTHREFNNYECSSHHLRVFYHCLDHCGIWMTTYNNEPVVHCSCFIELCHICFTFTSQHVPSLSEENQPKQFQHMRQLHQRSQSLLPQ